MDDGPIGSRRVLFAGDVHLHPGRPDVAERFARFLESEVPGVAALHLIGDLFDRWVSPRQARLPFYAEALDRVARAATTCGGITFVPGNRDFLLDGATAARGGMTRMPLRHEVRLGDERVLVTHGDLLCTRDRPYQRMRALLRLPFVTWLSRGMPLRTAAAMGDSLRGASRRAVAAKPADVDGLAPETVGRVMSCGAFDALVCGHVHRPGEQRLEVGGRERRVFVVPDWHEAAGWVEWEAGTWRVVHEGGAPLEARILLEARAEGAR